MNRNLDDIKPPFFKSNSNFQEKLREANWIEYDTFQDQKHSFLKSLQVSLYAVNKTLFPLIEIQKRILEAFFNNHKDKGLTNKIKGKERYLLSNQIVDSAKEIAIFKYHILRILADGKGDTELIFPFVAKAFNCDICIYKTVNGLFKNLRIFKQNLSELKDGKKLSLRFSLKNVALIPMIPKDFNENDLNFPLYSNDGSINDDSDLKNVFINESLKLFKDEAVFKNYLKVSEYEEMVPKVSKIIDSKTISKSEIETWHIANDQDKINDGLIQVFPELLGNEDSEIKSAEGLKEFIKDLRKRKTIDYNYISNVINVIIKNYDYSRLKDSFDKETLAAFYNEFVAKKNSSNYISEIFEKILYICSPYGLYKNICFKFLDYETGKFSYEIKLPLHSVFIDKEFDPDFFTIYITWCTDRKAYAFYSEPETEKNNIELEKLKRESIKLSKESISDNYIQNSSLTTESDQEHTSTKECMGNLDNQEELKIVPSKIFKVIISSIISIAITLLFLNFIDLEYLF